MMKSGKGNNFRLVNRRGTRRGTILITTMAICFALAAVVLVLTRKMAVEATASANQAAAVQANAVELGAEEYCKGLLTYAKTNGDDYYSVLDYNTYDETYFAAVQLGSQGQSDGWFWILRPVYDADSDMPLFGLVDENSKLDINFPAMGGDPRPTATPFSTAQSTAAYTAFQMLPGMTQEVAAAMADWRDLDLDPTDNIGAENDYYQTLADPYYCKDFAYDSVDELLMVRDMTRQYVYGDGTASPMGRASDTPTNGGGPGGLDDPQVARGVYDLLTVDAYSPPGASSPPGATQVVGLINVNTAPRAVLYCIPNIDPGDVDTAIAYRTQNSLNGGSGDSTWFATAIGNRGYDNYITGYSNRYSADILAVSKDGRSFKRVRIVIDVATPITLADGTTSTVPTIISRHDITDQGWPLDPAVLASIRRGEGPPSDVGGSNNTVIGGTLR